MQPVEFQMRIHIAATPDEVWPYLVDWEGLGRWMQEGSDFRVTSPHREGVGVEATAKIRIAGLSTDDPIRVVRWEPPFLLKIEHLGWVKGMGTLECSPSDNGTDLLWKEKLDPPWGFLGTMGMRLWQPLMQRTFEKDLLQLKRLVESDRVGGAVIQPSPEQPRVPPSRRVKAVRTRLQRPVFARWLLLVYLPLALLVVAAVLWLAGDLPQWAMPFLLALALWGAAAGWLLMERFRRRQAGRLGETLLTLLWLAFLGAIGSLFGWIGLETASTPGFLLMLVGLFLISVAVFASIFKLIDVTARWIYRGISKRPPTE